MTRPHARAGQPYEYPIDYAGHEPEEEAEIIERIELDSIIVSAVIVVVVLFVLAIVAMAAGYWSMK